MTANLKAVPDADAAATPQAAQPLTASERHALIGLQARHDEYTRIINDAEREIIAAINERLGVSLGSTHIIDPQMWAVVETSPTG